MNEEVLSKDLLEVTYTESNSQDGTSNSSRHSRFGKDQVWTQSATTTQFAAIRDDVYYSASQSEGEEAVPSREKIAESGRGTITPDVAQRNYQRIYDIASLEGSGVFDIFTSDTVVAKSIEEDVANGVNTVTIAAYDEENSNGFNYAYAAVFTIDDETDTLTSITISTNWAFDDYWDFTAHDLAGNAGSNGYTKTIRVRQGDIQYGTYADNEDFFYDFSGAFITEVTRASVFAEDISGMGGGTTGEANKVHVGDYLVVIVDEYLPATAVDYSSITITGSSNPEVISVTEDGFNYYAVGAGTSTLTLGNAFDANLGTVEVEVSEESSSGNENAPQIYGFNDDPNFEFIDDGGELSGRFTVPSGEQTTYFTAMVLNNDYTITGDEVTVENTDICYAWLEPGDESMTVKLAIMGFMSGTTRITLPTYFGPQTYEVKVVTKPMLGEIHAADGYTPIDTGDYWGQFDVSLAEGKVEFLIDVYNSGYTLSGSEIISNNDDIAIVKLEEYGTEDDYLLAITIDPQQVGEASFTIPSSSMWSPDQLYKVVVTE